MSDSYLKDRKGELLTHPTLNGIDFVDVDSKQTTLTVRFLNSVVVKAHQTTARIAGGVSVTDIAVDPVQEGDWSIIDGHPALTLTVEKAGDFSIYTLEVENKGLDLYYSKCDFSFKANCPSDLDCKTPEVECPPADGDLPFIDYFAKDFLSFKRALLDFSAQKYPSWRERSEADFGLMFLEALSSVADDLSYLQDRIAWEPMIEEARERISINRLARLVDYNPRPATASQVLLQLNVKDTTTSIRSGLGFIARSAEGTDLYFEAGNGLLDVDTGKITTKTFTVSSAWNRGALVPYTWDKSEACLAAGATEMWIEGHGHRLTEGTKILIDTAAHTSADEPVREVVRLTKMDEIEDPIYLTAGLPTPVTRVAWDEGLPLKKDHPLFWSPDQLKDHNNNETRTVLAGNLVPATHGETVSENFTIPDSKGGLPSAAPSGTTLAAVRTGPNDSPEAPVPLYLYTLGQEPLAWLNQKDATAAGAPHPEIALEQTGTGSSPDWAWLRSLMDASVFQPAYTLEPSKYVQIADYGDGKSAHEYDGDDGQTIRFGDGVFGELPAEGAVFRATYRIGGGEVGNVARDTITTPGTEARTLVDASTNPFAATSGMKEETDDEVRRDAPQAFRAKQYRAVRREDYEASVETLDWVQKAGTRFRWTGSWLTIFTSADPRDAQSIAVTRHLAMIDLLNRYRMAGYESYAPPPRYVAIDLQIKVCACDDAFLGHVKEELLKTLSNKRLTGQEQGFFHPDKLTFGQPLERSTIESAIENSYGVCGVRSIMYRRRGFTADFVELPDTVLIGRFEILRVDNDASLPENGTLKITVEGGK